MTWAEYGNAASGAGQVELADQCWQKALGLAPGNADLIGMIGHQYQGMRQPEKAGACFAQAAAAAPRSINPRISLAVLLEKSHRLEEARAAVEECLAIDPKDDQARYFSAVLDRRQGQLESRRNPAPRPHRLPAQASVRSLRLPLRTGPDSRPARPVRRGDAAAGRGEADCGRPHGYRSFAQKLRPGRGKRAALHSQPAQNHSPHLGSSTSPKPSASRIPPLAFLGGHPRSGTTLLEQVLDAHPGVAALDEPTAFLDLLQPEFHKSKELSSARLNTLRRLYTQALLREAGPAATGKLLLDKNPSPTARMPLWLKVFPELRVLIALRDPRDVVLSCYFQNIPLNAANVNFLSFERLARHYADLMDIWLAVREWEGFAWLEVRYEDTVADLEKEGRRVTEFLALAWHEDQVRFYEKSRTKQLYSPTYQDVTRPVYSRSVARWRAYEKHLAPILPALEPYCRTFGYE